MSSSERRRWSKRDRVLCAACQERKAKFRYRREVRADRDHTLCFACYRSEVNRTRARRLAEGAHPGANAVSARIPTDFRWAGSRQPAGAVASAADARPPATHRLLVVLGRRAQASAWHVTRNR